MEEGNEAVRDQARRRRERETGRREPQSSFCCFYRLTNTKYLLNVSTVLGARTFKVNFTAGPTVRELTSHSEPKQV